MSDAHYMKMELVEPDAEMALTPFDEIDAAAVSITIHQFKDDDAIGYGYSLTLLLQTGVDSPCFPVIMRSMLTSPDPKELAMTAIQSTIPLFGGKIGASIQVVSVDDEDLPPFDTMELVHEMSGMGAAPKTLH